MPLKVIGAGLGRTGTSSLKLALEHLGFGPCYHMKELMADDGRLSHWLDAEAGRPVDWEALFEGYSAAVDYPASPYWRELSERYPAAKIILTVRDPAKWYESVSTTIRQASRRGYADGNPISHMVTRTVWDGQFSGRFEDPEHAMRVFQDYNQKVIDEADPSRLLVYSSGDGWEPICGFLEVPVPDQPYPRSNTRQEFQDRMNS